MMRADSCGDGNSITREGVPGGRADRVGIGNDQSKPGVACEAASSPDEAVCTAHVRIPVDASVPALVVR